MQLVRTYLDPYPDANFFSRLMTNNKLKTE